MRLLEIDQSLNTSFWEEYAVLWHNSNVKSPFQAPGILKYFSGQFPDRVVAIRLVVGQNLMGAVILKKENGVYSFLSDLKTDANFFVFHKECSDEDIKFFFTGLLDTIRKRGWTVVFNRVALWAAYMPILEQCGAESSLFYQAIDYSVCPVLKCETPEEILHVISRTRTLRTNANKLKSKLNAEFEVLTGDEDLESWVGEFCNCHIMRWEKTSTPSAFRNSDRQHFLLKCLYAWSAERVLVRFAVKINRQRVGFHIGLIDGNSLIGHSLTYHPDYYKFSPAKVLLLTIAEWMIGKRLSILDFGNGNEKYKYNFTNKERVLKKLMISRKTNYSFMAKSKLIKVIKSNPGIYNFYQRKIKRYLTLK